MKDSILERIFRVIGIHHATYIEIGTQIGIECNSRYWRVIKGWEGFQLDAVAGVPEANLHSVMVKPETVNELLLERWEEHWQWDDAWHYGESGTSRTEDSTSAAAAADSSSKEARRTAPIVTDWMSIDIDSFDWHVWRAILLENKFRPRVLMIEHIKGAHGGVVDSSRSRENFAGGTTRDNGGDVDGTTTSGGRDDDSTATQRRATTSRHHQNHHHVRWVSRYFNSTRVAVDGLSAYTHWEHYAPSLQSFVDLGNAFGYDLVYYGDTDLIFVDNREFREWEEEEVVSSSGGQEKELLLPPIAAAAAAASSSHRTPPRDVTRPFLFRNDVYELCKAYRVSGRPHRRYLATAAPDYCDWPKSRFTRAEYLKHFWPRGSITREMMRDSSVRL